MAKVTFRSNNPEVLSEIAKSGDLAAQLEPIADAILQSASNDPNEAYVASLRKNMFVSGGRAGRVSWQVGAEPTLGSRVEAKRGTLQRAVGAAGL